MAVYPGAVFYGNCRNNSGRRTAATRGLVIHVNDGPNVSLWHWVNDPASNMSCHFQILQNGLIEQYGDTELFMWCQKAGNNPWISVEMPTYPSVGMTKAQLASAAKLSAWLSKLYAFPLQLTNDPSGAGIGWHGMGAHPGYPDDWGHPLCPGVIRRAQLPALLAAAKGGTTVEDDYDMPGYSSWSAADKEAFWADGTKEIVTRALGGYGSPETVGQALASASLAARNTSAALNDPTHGVVVTLARIDSGMAQLPAQLQAVLDAHPADAPLDAEAIIDALFDRWRGLLDAAPTGNHAAGATS
jgi:hypothetical protein